ncbi:MAG TPA: sigma factor, partial [Longimicrobium sp.]
MTDDVALLVERALGGDPDAADRLVRLHMGAAYAVALAVTRNPHEAEDVAQDALVLALERLAECRDPRKFGGWLVRI